MLNPNDMNDKKDINAQGVHISERIPLRGITRMTSILMMQSHQEYAAITGMLELDFTKLEDFRKRFLTDKFEDSASLTLTALMLKVTALSLKEHPTLNSSLIDNQIQILEEINIGLAVAMENGQLVVPVIRNVDKLSISEISNQASHLAKKIRKGKIDLEDVSGGTFTFSNFGMFGGDIATPLINPPQSAILAMGRVIPKPVVVNEEIVIRKMGWISVTVDHRIINGVQAAKFGQTIDNIISNPQKYLSD
jgi:pyruvate dehydrogenase E2 component (dihydrolipoamide acetyltransferase)